jgi:hypothetical protein
MRRPNMLRYNTWLGECLEVVANNPNPLPFDKYLVGWAQLSKIAEEIHSSFSFDDPGNMVNLSEPRVQIMLNSFVKALEAWRRSLGPEGSHGVLSCANIRLLSNGYRCFITFIPPHTHLPS